MKKAVLPCVVLSALLATTAAKSSMCEGIWNIDKIEKCENSDQYPIALEVIKRKLNRSIDCFSTELEFPEEVGEDYGLRMESFEKCDGGYKPSDVVTGALCHTLNQYAKEIFQEALGNAGVEHRDCPIPKGKYAIKDFVMNYPTLPEQGKCGDQFWDVYLINNAEKMACVRAYTTFTQREEDYEEEE